ncbi:MAG: hypothetical protein LCH67_05075 [Bacteroidetes bacterium]|nr:hypothetical protein [Bacteroidota bacterium]
MNRKQFLQKVGIGSALLPALSSFTPGNISTDLSVNEQYILDANKREVDRLLEVYSKPIANLRRSLGFDLANLAAGYTEPKSAYFQSATVLTPMEAIVNFLISEQKPDGTLDFGNLSSPPDTAFIIDPLCAAARILRESGGQESLRQKLKAFITKAADQLAIGGVHTPNHRWVVSSALAKVNALFPHKKYMTRINQWLAEKVFADQDGVYLERSITYAEVVNRSLIFLADYAQKTELLKNVEKNLNWLFHMMEPNGDMVTVQSRRQDAFHHRNVTEFYIHYRYMAIKTGNPLYASMLGFIEKMPDFEEIQGRNLLYYIRENPFLAKEPRKDSLPTKYERLYEGINLLRKRNEKESLTLFAGTDWPTIVASGRSSNPSLLMYRKGDAILKYLRISTSFFSIGYIRGKGIKKTATGYQTQFSFEAPYYQPLPEKYLKADGDYELSPSTDGRFWNKMDFQNRPQSNVQRLNADINYEEKSGKHLLNIRINAQQGVKVVIEMCFDENGKFIHSGEIESGSGENYFLKEGYVIYKSGNDEIKIGPGVQQHKSVQNLEGEMYSTHFGSLKTNGKYLYITGICPFEYTLEIS